MSRNEFVMIILILGFLLKVYCLCFLKCISAVTLLSISFSIASPGEQQSYSFYNNAGNNHIARGFSFTHCDENSLALVEKFEGFSLEFGLKTCKLPEATKHQNLQKLAHQVPTCCLPRLTQVAQVELGRVQVQGHSWSGSASGFAQRVLWYRELVRPCGINNDTQKKKVGHSSLGVSLP